MGAYHFCVLCIVPQANLLTGVVNLSVESIYVPNLKATLVLIAYLGAVTVIAWVLKNRRLRI